MNGVTKQFNDIIRDPKFWELAQQSQIEVLSRVDPNFGKLKPESQLTVLSRITPKTQFQERPPEAAGQPISETAAITGGGIAGGMAGAKLGVSLGPLGIAAGSVVGTVVGAGAGEAYYQIAQNILDSPDAPDTSRESAMRILNAGVGEGMWEAGAQVATRGVGKLLAPMARKVLPEARATMDWLSSRIRPLYTPAEATESRVLDIAQNIGEYSILGGGRIRSLKLKRQELFSEIADDIINEFGPRMSADEVGEVFSEAINQKEAIHQAAASIKYNAAADLSKLPDGSFPKVSTASLKQFAEPIEFTASEIGRIGGDDAGYGLADTILDMEDKIDLHSATELRSNLLGYIRNVSSSPSGKNAKGIGRAEKIIELIDQEIERSLVGVTPDARDAWREANAFYKEGKERFNNALIRSLVKLGEREPEKVADIIFKAKNITKIKRVKDILSPQEWSKLQSYYMESSLRKAEDPITGEVIGKKLKNLWFGPRSGLPETSWRTAFTPEQLSEYKLFVDALILGQSKQAEGTGRMLIQLSQGAAFANLAASPLTGGPLQKTSGLILFGPPILSQMLTNPITVKWLTTGFQIPASSPQAVGIALRLIKAANDINKQMLEE